MEYEANWCWLEGLVEMKRVVLKISGQMKKSLVEE
jgi:hypothetical protein